jgi:lipopolysaccharide assembly outer membrane protein LptD (OstA)
MGKLTAKFVGVKNGFKLDNASWFLGISLGPSYYKGDHLDAIIELIKKEKFSKGRLVMLADTLQAYNLMAYDENLTLEDARNSARQEGEKWFNSEDGEKIQQLNLTQQIIRWDEIINHSAYPEKKQLIDNLYIPKEDRRALEPKTSEKEIKRKLQSSAAVDRDVGQRIASIKSSLKSDKDFDFQRIRPLIIDYVKEECAGELIIGEFFCCDYEPYPGERNSATTFLHKNYIPENILQWLTIKFNKVNESAKKKYLLGN